MAVGRVGIIRGNQLDEVCMRILTTDISCNNYYPNRQRWQSTREHNDSRIAQFLGGVPTGPPDPSRHQAGIFPLCPLLAETRSATTSSPPN